MTQPDPEVVQKIAAEARRRQGAAREAFLEDTCGTDIALRELVEQRLQPQRLGTLVPQQLDVTATHIPDAPSQHSLHPKQATTRFIPGTNMLVRVWASKLYRTVAIVSLVVLIILLGIGSRYLVWNELRKIREQEFTALLAADVQALTMWIETRKDHLQVVATDPEIRDAIFSMAEKQAKLGKDYSHESIQEELQVFRDRLPEFNRDKEDAQRFVDSNDPLKHNETLGSSGSVPKIIDDEGVYFVASPTGVILAATEESIIGTQLPGNRHARVISDTVMGRTGFIPPMRPQQESELDETNPDLTLTWVYTPIKDQGPLPSAVLSLGYFSVGNFTRSLTSARTGATGEAYAFDENGRMLTESRFTEDLWRHGILPEGTPSRANLVIQPPHARHHPPGRADSRFTQLVEEAINSRGTGNSSGLIMDPYGNYLGRNTIGAWQWLDDYNFGVAYETQTHEAFRPYTYISIAQISLLVLVAGFAGLAYYAANSLVQMRRTIGEHTVVGAYELLRKVGEGGMGQVYLAKHQMLKRPTAVKLLRPEQTDPQLLIRFEREVQLSSRLKHPNTVEIYDYGKTPNDVFYYAMEYLDGITLEVLVRQYGWQSVARVLWVMRQVAASLREAHDSGLIHRDIKPLNIMLCRVGGEFDVAKVLDFGLVKNLSADAGTTLVTNTTEISGTPMYIPPERVKNPTQADPRVDIYALGATAYFMLTGQTIYNAASAVDVLVQIVTKPIPSIKEASDRIVPDALQDLISRCLAKDPKDRPQSAEEVIQEVEKMIEDFPWTQQDAKNWWDQHIPADELIEMVIHEDDRNKPAH